ncbi:MAG TPA: transcription termination/antitermination protein NusA [Desulfobacteraceae bacterium]|nr:transcription termination/antitermination protein NusA [Desulfobacteraceae bacterium]
MASELSRVIDQVCREKGLDRKVLIESIEEAVRIAARKRYGNGYDIEIQYNDELGEVEVFEFKEVVDKIADERLQISLEDARKIDPECEIGDSLGIKKDTEELGRIAAQAAKQVIMQRLREAERDMVYDDYKDRRGEIIHGIVQRFDRGSIIVNLGRTDAELPPKEQIPKETYKQGDRIRAYIVDVKHYASGAQIILSRTHPNFLAALLENEVPEISEGIVEIVSVVRDPGSRAKVAVRSREADVDPVGACVGMKGTRIQAVVQELRGEKIDVVPWDPDPAKFVCNALSPAEITRVIVDEDERAMEIVVPDDQLSLAIGKRGQNVRLASKLTGWNMEVTSESEYNEALKEISHILLNVEGINERTGLGIYQAGFRSAKDIAIADPEELAGAGGLDLDSARKVIENARRFLEEQVKEDLNLQ